MTTATDALPMILDEVAVVSVERLSPSYLRLELGSPVLADFGVDGPLYDQRIKLVFPDGDGPLPSFEGADESWFTTWLARPVRERGHMRTYTVREVRGAGDDTRLVVTSCCTASRVTARLAPARPGRHGPAWATA